jgi:hypothetical protein
MAIGIVPLEQLTEPERGACTDYYADATFLHACAQGWSGEFRDSPQFRSFVEKCPQLVKHLDLAIQKFEMSADEIVFSGHGRGISVIGSLSGPPGAFIGLRYCYPGYTSTSEDRGIAENFLRAKASGAKTPVLMEFHLKKGQRILPVSMVTRQGGEVEYLLGRSVEFEIANADSVRIQGVDQDILHLVLT